MATAPRPTCQRPSGEASVASQMTVSVHSTGQFGSVIRALDALGEDTVMEMLAAGDSYRDIARLVNCSSSGVVRWLQSDPERHARAQAAMVAAADEHAALAGEVLRDVADRDDVPRAREISAWHRWMAKVRRPQTYGDKVEMTGEVHHTHDPIQIDARLQALVGTVEYAKITQGAVAQPVLPGVDDSDTRSLPPAEDTEA